MTPTRRCLAEDLAGIILTIVSVYWTFVLRQHLYSASVFLIAGLAAFALRRRSHPSSVISNVSRFVWSYAPSAVILIFVGASLVDFGRYFTRADFGMFYASGLQLRTDPAHLYDVVVQHEFLEKVTGALEYHYLSFPYPPFVAALFIPLSYLSLRAAYYVVAGANCILLSAAVYLLCRNFCRTRSQAGTLILAASALLPIYINLILGQMAFVGLLLYSLFAIDLLRKRPARAGLWVALLSYKLMLVPIPLFVLCIKRAWTGLLVAISGLLILLAVSVALVGSSGVIANYRVMMTMTDESLKPRMQSLTALAHYFGMPDAVHWLLAVCIVASLWITERRGGKPMWSLAGAVLATLLVSPYVQTYDLSLGLLVIALIAGSFPEISDSRRILFFLVAFLPAFVGVAGMVNGRGWPAVPAVAFILFIYCLHRSTQRDTPPLQDRAAS